MSAFDLNPTPDPVDIRRQNLFADRSVTACAAEALAWPTEAAAA